MMKAAFIWFIMLMALVSCKQNEEKTQGDSGKIIPREKMVILMAEMQIVEAHIDELRKAGHKTKDSTLFYYQKVFSKNEVMPADFENCLMYYKKDLEQLQLLYADVITRLSELKAKNEELLLERKADSPAVDSAKNVQIEKVETHSK
jgi:hypothetical protein